MPPKDEDLSTEARGAAARLILLLLATPDAAPLLMLCVRARGKKMPKPSAVDGLASHTQLPYAI